MNIQEFINQDYHKALSTLVQFQPNLPVIATLQRGPTEYNRSKLAYLYEKYSISIPQYQPQVQTSITYVKSEAYELVESKPEQKVHEDAFTGKNLEELSKISEQRKALFKKGSFLHAKLDEQNLDDAERKKMVFDILAIYDEHIPQLDQKEAYIKKHGLTPAAETKIPTEKPITRVNLSDKLEVYKRISTLKKNISRDKKKHPERAATYQIELDYLKQHE